MIKRTSRNFKVPLVYGGQWKDHQSFQKWDPISKRIVSVNCCLPEKCYEPDPVTNVTIDSIEAGGVYVSWTYNGPPVEFEINLYTSITENVDTSGTPVYSQVGSFVSGQIVFYTTVSHNYYVASVRVRNKCLFSIYSYSNTLQYIFLGYNYAINAFEDSGNPPSGTMDIFNIYIFNWGLNISIYDNTSTSRLGFLNTLATATFIKIQKDLDNYEIYTRNSHIDYGTYWWFDCTSFNKRGVFHAGDIVNITYSNSS